MENRWPWEVKELLPQDNYTLILSTTDAPQLTPTGSSTWLLKTPIIGRYCIAGWGTTYTHTLQGNSTIMKLWEKLHGGQKIEKHQPDAPNTWQAPAGLSGVCGQPAHRRLPEKWIGACVLGIIKPSFFLLPSKQRESLGYPMYDGPKHRNK
ncbi:Endogenous retrovirus group 3 member 1 Env polyprotein [Plecturocebus cupreus]